MEEVTAVRQNHRAHGIDMPQWIDRHPARQIGSIVAELPGGKASDGFVQGDSKQDGQHPGGC